MKKDKNYQHPMPFCQEVAQSLIDNGFIEHKCPGEAIQKLDYGIFSKRFFMKRIKGIGRTCTTNEKLHYNVTLFYSNVNTLHGYDVSAELSIVGETPSVGWVDLKIYSLKPHDLIENIDDYCNKILSAWLAVY